MNHSRKTTISLSMIARDEERFLPACLESVRDVVDEIVLVDTGSKDNTVQIARNAGAKVTTFDWVDDFSAARNAALQECSCDWVLSLDADECLAPDCGPRIRAAISSTASNRILLPLYNASRLDASPEAVLSGAACQGSRF